MTKRNDKLLPIRFELMALRQWAKIGVHRSFTIDSLKGLLAAKFNCDFEHMPIRASIVVSKQGKNHKEQVSTTQPIQEIEYFRDPLQEHRVIIELDYWGG
jgi:hypothetical protein